MREADKNSFMIESYRLLFERNSKAQEHRWSFIQWSLFGILAFYGGIFTSESTIKNSSLIDYLIWLPVPLCILGGALAWGLREGMIERGRVMQSIEDQFGTPGWQNERDIAGQRRLIKAPLAATAFGYWIFMLVVTSIVAIAENRDHLI